jgi:hypothetical protein
MRRLLDSKGIPLLSIKNYGETMGTYGKANYKGFSEELGGYDLILEVDTSPQRKERIILNAKRKGTIGFGEMQKLVDCVTEYLALYEAKVKDEKEKAHKVRIKASEPESGDGKKDTARINLPVAKPARTL